MSGAIRVVVAGAAGRMGREVVRAVTEQGDLQLTGAVDVAHAGEDAGTLAGLAPLGVLVTTRLEDCLGDADVVVDFSVPGAVRANTETCIRAGVSPVVGATGLSGADMDALAALAAHAGLGAVVAPNFAIGAVLLMEFARQAARHMPDAEIIELHHERKVDAPSGTALRTAALIAGARAGTAAPEPAGAHEAVPGARGAQVHGVRVHSVRLPGLVAHQEVVFGGAGQILSIRHDSTDRTSFMPGVLLAIRRVRDLTGLVVGLEHLLLPNDER